MATYAHSVQNIENEGNMTLYFHHMQQARSSSPLFVIARAIIGYGVWFVSVPAICLQFFGILVALFSIYLLFLQWNPDATADVLKSVLTFFHIFLSKI